MRCVELYRYHSGIYSFQFLGINVMALVSGMSAYVVRHGIYYSMLHF